MALLAKSPLMVMMSRTRWPEEHFAGQSFDVPSPDSRRARVQIEIAAPERCNLVLSEAGERGEQHHSVEAAPGSVADRSNSRIAVLAAPGRRDGSRLSLPAGSYSRASMA